jgi:hypothetical protein
VARRDTLFDETTPALAGGDVTHESWFLHGMCNAAAAYASSAGTDMAAYDDLPGYHLLAAKSHYHQQRVIPRLRHVSLLAKWRIYINRKEAQQRNPSTV